MTSPSTEITDSLVIEENVHFQMDNLQVTILSYLGLLAADVHYFRVDLKVTKDGQIHAQSGLLRVGELEGELARELKLRESLGNYRLLGPLLAHDTRKSILINPELSFPQENSSVTNLAAEELTTETTLVLDEKDVDTATGCPEIYEIDASVTDFSGEEFEYFADVPMAELETEIEYLDEEHYPAQDVITTSSQERLFLLTSWPEKKSTLAYWLQQEHSLKEVLSLVIQMCQFCSRLYQDQWCLVNFMPDFIKIDKSLKFFDLTNTYTVGKRLSLGFIGNYCAPELAIGTEIDQLTSIYSLGALLYQCLHQSLPSSEQNLKIKPIPLISQIIKICLSPLKEDRPSLSQLLSLLLTARQEFHQPKIDWQAASKTTVGLSPLRLQNEDSYGFREKQNGARENIILAMVADGMGGMEQGGVASQIAVTSILESKIPTKLKTKKQWNRWLMNLLQTSNEKIVNQLYNSGTTLSLVLAINNKLMIAHVGDSRIYLIRKRAISQLTEDHSLAAMLVSSGDITEAEALEFNQRNILTKYLGSTHLLSDGYIQDLHLAQQSLSMLLEDQDILLLCSDGVWDLVPQTELLAIFTATKNLQLAVNKTINQVLERGAPDNATLLALKCQISDRDY